MQPLEPRSEYICMYVYTVRPMHVQLHEGQHMCAVCNDVANGIHFGALTCEGCKVCSMSIKLYHLLLCLLLYKIDS